jgi:hypothetical protein
MGIKKRIRLLMAPVVKRIKRGREEKQRAEREKKKRKDTLRLGRIMSMERVQWLI